MLSNGIPTLLLKHATLKSKYGNRAGTVLTVGAYQNSMSSICMPMLTKYHSNYWDVIPCHLSDLNRH